MECKVVISNYEKVESKDAKVPFSDMFAINKAWRDAFSCDCHCVTDTLEQQATPSLAIHKGIHDLDYRERTRSALESCALLQLYGLNFKA
jgi:hypothetical protein